LGDDLRIARAAEVTNLLASACDAGSVEIEAAQVERVDAAGLQALVVGIARLRKAKVARHWAGVSPTLAAAAALAGLVEALEISGVPDLLGPSR